MGASAVRGVSQNERDYAAHRKGEHSMTYSRTVNRDGAVTQSKRLAPGIATILIVALSLVCWVPVILAEMAVWSAFN
jgi:hypothetical protein